MPEETKTPEQIAAADKTTESQENGVRTRSEAQALAAFAKDQETRKDAGKGDKIIPGDKKTPQQIAAEKVIANPRFEAAKKAEPAKEEPKQEVKEEVEESEFDLDVENIEGAPNDNPTSFDRKRWKDLDDDIDTDNFNEEVVYERAKAYKTKATQAMIVAEASNIIDNDPTIKTLSGHLKRDDESLVFETEKATAREKGLDESAATERAQTKVTLYKDKGYLELKAGEIREDVEGFIGQRKQQITHHIESTRKALSLSDAPNPKLVAEAIEALEKQDNFLGLKFGGKSEQARKDFVKPIAEKIKNGSLLKKIQNDPALLAKVALLAEYEGSWQKAISKRVETEKTKALKSMSDAPYATPQNLKKPSIEQPAEAKPTALKNAATFK